MSVHTNEEVIEYVFWIVITKMIKSRINSYLYNKNTYLDRIYLSFNPWKVLNKV